MSKSMTAGANQIIKLINDTISAALEEQRVEAREMMKNMRTYADQLIHFDLIFLLHHHISTITAKTRKPKDNNAGK